MCVKRVHCPEYLRVALCLSSGQCQSEPLFPSLKSFMLAANNEQDV